MSKTTFINIDSIPDGFYLQTEVRQETRQYLINEDISKRQFNTIEVSREIKNYCFQQHKNDKENMTVTTTLDITPDFVLAVLVEAEVKGYADNVFAQLTKLYSSARLQHLAELLTTPTADHMVGNIDTPQQKI